jgi:hypothetical protein
MYAYVYIARVHMCQYMYVGFVSAASTCMYVCTCVCVPSHMHFHVVVWKYAGTTIMLALEHFYIHMHVCMHVYVHVHF